MTWEELVSGVTADHPRAVVGRLFGMPCLKGDDGKVIVALWSDGGIAVKLVDEAARAAALELPGAAPGSHAFDPDRPMRQWVHLPVLQAHEWRRVVERALG